MERLVKQVLVLAFLACNTAARAATATFTPVGPTTVDPGTDVTFEVTVSVASLGSFDTADVVIGSPTATDVAFSYDAAWTAAFANPTTPAFDNGFYPQDVFVGGNNATPVGASLLLGTVTVNTTGLGGGLHTVLIDYAQDAVSALGLAGQPETLSGSGSFTVTGPAANPAASAPPPHDRPKNRYVSFTPNNGTNVVAFRVDRTVPAPALTVGWVGAPDAAGLAQIVPQPVTRVWAEAVVHAGDCEIGPVATYAILASSDGGGSFTAALAVSTVGQPVPKAWGDTVGEIQFGAWTAPNGVVNVNDFIAALQKFQATATAPHITVVDVQAVSSTDPCLNRLANVADIFLLIKAFQGGAYPFTTDPTTCPPCP